MSDISEEKKAELRAVALTCAVQVALVNAASTGNIIGFVQSMQPHLEFFERYIIKGTPLDADS